MWLKNKINKKLFLVLNLLLLSPFFNFSKADNNNISFSESNQVELEYLESRNELEDYIIDTGDSIHLDFFPAYELTGVFPVNEEGELILPNLDETYVRGLTTFELRSLLEKKYSEILIEPEIKVKIAVFKGVRVSIRGEVKNPGIYKFPSYASASIQNLPGEFEKVEIDKSPEKDDYSPKPLELFPERFDPLNDNTVVFIDKNSKFNTQNKGNNITKRTSENIINISDVIRAAGGITSETDLSKITIIRDVPLGKGGGKKRAFIDFNSYLNEADPTNDIRIYDGDSLFLPKLSESNPNQIPKSILLGISPKFITVTLFGRIENPGFLKLPLEATLSDALDLSGPIKPLSGKIVLLRYNKDGTIVKNQISYSASARRGSKRNPFLEENDVISVKNSVFQSTLGVLNEFTKPFIGIYTTKELIESF